MAEGHCNCHSITVTLPKPPSRSLLCHCTNCRRAGAAPFTVNYYLDKSDVELKDPKGVLKSYQDSNTASGNTIIRQFCGTCGSPVMTLLSEESPKVFLKGGLFDHISAPVMELFEHNKLPWLEVAKLGAEEKI